MLERVLEPEVMDSPEEAASYDAMDHTAANDAFVQRLVELGATGSMLDIGTGPGHIPLRVCDRIEGARIFAADLSKAMLAIARQHLDASPHADRVDFHLADAKELPFEDGAFDAVFSNTILHHIHDPAPFLTEAWRVLRPGGVLLIRDLFRPSDQATLDRLVTLYAGDCDETQRRLFAESLHAALTPTELQAMAIGLGVQAKVVVDTDRHMSLQCVDKPA